MLISRNNMETGTGGTQASAVQLFSYTLNHADAYGVVYSGVKFDGDGIMYILQSSNNYSKGRPWLLAGAATSFYLTRIINEGSLDTDAGAGPLQMNTDRIYYISQKFNGRKSAIVDFEISSDSSGSPVIANCRMEFIARLTEAPGGR